MKSILVIAIALATIIKSAPDLAEGTVRMVREEGSGCMYPEINVDYEDRERPMKMLETLAAEGWTNQEYGNGYLRRAYEAAQSQDYKLVAKYAEKIPLEFDLYPSAIWFSKPMQEAANIAEACKKYLMNHSKYSQSKQILNFVFSRSFEVYTTLGVSRD